MHKLLEFSHARESLKFIIKKYGIKELFIPYYLCDVIRHTLFEIKCKPKFYHIDNNFMPALEFNKLDYILYPNYFGICDKNIESLTKNYPNIIIDNAHSFFSNPKGLACFNSAEKFGIETKSYLWLDTNCNNIFIEKYKNIAIRRRSQFLKYCKLYNGTNLINIPQDCIPFCYPYLAKTEELANKIVRKFNDNNIIIYRYWNQLPKTYNEYKFYSRLVPIPLCANSIPQDN